MFVRAERGLEKFWASPGKMRELYGGRVHRTESLRDNRKFAKQIAVNVLISGGICVYLVLKDYSCQFRLRIPGFREVSALLASDG